MWWYKYPESYGVYLTENMNSIKKIEFSEYMLGTIDFKEISNTKNQTPISLWFYDPKIIPTDLKLGRVAIDIDDAESITFDTKPIDGKSGLYKIEINQPIEDGIYSLYGDNFIDGARKTDVQWAFLIVNKKSKSFIKKKVLGKWEGLYKDGSMEFLKNGIFKGNQEGMLVNGNYTIKSSDLLQLKNKGRGKTNFTIHFISDKLLIIGREDTRIILTR